MKSYNLKKTITQLHENQCWQLQTKKSTLFLFFTIGLFCQSVWGQNFETEFFHVAYTEKTDFIWSDKGMGGDDIDMVIRKPNAPAGYFIFGDVLGARDGAQDPEDVKDFYSIALKPKPGFEHLLQPPSSWKQIWNDTGSDADKDVSIWALNCPSGYVALGHAALQNNDEVAESLITNRKDCRCIKKLVTYNGGTYNLVREIKFRSKGSGNEGQKVDVKAFWDDSGSGAKNDVALFHIGVGAEIKAPKNHILMAPNVFFASKEHEKFPDGKPYALLIYDDSDKYLPKEKPKPNLPVLNSTEAPTDGPVEITTYKIPFFQVADDRYPSAIVQAKESPMYEVKKTSYYTPGTTVLGRTKDGDTGLSWSIEKSKERSKDWSSNWGVEIGASVSVGVEANAAPLGVGGTASATVSASIAFSGGHSWGGSESTGVSRAGAVTVKVNYDQRAVIYEVVDEYKISRTDGSEVEGYKPKLPNYYVAFETAFYPPNNASASTPSTNTPSTNTPTGPAKWIKMPGNGKKIRAGGNGKVFVLGTDNELYQWNNSNDSWMATGRIVDDFAIAPDNSLWTIENGSIYRFGTGRSTSAGSPEGMIFQGLVQSFPVGTNKLLGYFGKRNNGDHVWALKQDQQDNNIGKFLEIQMIQFDGSETIAFRVPKLGENTYITVKDDKQVYFVDAGNGGAPDAAKFKIGEPFMTEGSHADRYHSFESVKYPSHFLRHAGWVLRVSPQSTSDAAFEKDASWLVN